MRNFVFYISLVVGLNAFAQTKPQVIKIKKGLKQSETNAVVTLCDKYYGDIKADDIYKNNQLKISNNLLGLKIISFNISFKRGPGAYSEYTTANDTLSLEIRKDLLTADINGRVFIVGIKAVSKNNDTLYLNPIILRIVN